MVKRHVQSCKFCQEHNKQAVKYSKYNFEAEPAPMKFISHKGVGRHCQLLSRERGNLADTGRAQWP